MREHHRRIRDALAGLGARGIVLRAGQRHPRFVFTFAGRPRRYVVSYSPSDYRATIRAITELRRLCRSWAATTTEP